MRRHGPDGRALGSEAYVFGTETGEPIKSIKRAWESTVLRAFGHALVWAKGAPGSDGHRGRRPGRLASESRAELRRINLHFHDLRRQFACTLLESSADLHDVRDFLGHANITTTSRYLASSPVRLARALARLEGNDAGFAHYSHTDGPVEDEANADNSGKSLKRKRLLWSRRMGSNHRPADYEQAAETPFPLYVALIFDGIYSACLAGFPPEIVNLNTFPVKGDKGSMRSRRLTSKFPQCVGGHGPRAVRRLNAIRDVISDRSLAGRPSVWTRRWADDWDTPGYRATAFSAARCRVLTALSRRRPEVVSVLEIVTSNLRPSTEKADSSWASRES